MAKKRKFFSLTALRNRLATHFNAQPSQNTLELIEQNNEFLKTIPGDDDIQLPTLPASKMTLQALKDIFGLEEDLNRCFMKISAADKIHVPEELERQIQEELEMLAEDPKNEAECRLQINPLFLDSLKRERRALAASPTPPPYLPSFTLETSLALEVVYKGRRMMLTGDMDYSMRYARDETAAGLVVFEAKKLATMGFGLAQCLTYMVMIHMIRKSENRENAVIWGVVSNGREWLFLRIDNDTKFCRWQPKGIWGPQTKDNIYTLLRLIMRNAAMSSPRTSTQPVRRISPQHPLTAYPARYHLRVGSADTDDEALMDF